MPTACVVGAGVSGLQTARALTYRGISCTVLEEGSSVGGAWASSNPALKLQSRFPVPLTCLHMQPGPLRLHMLNACSVKEVV
jgi:cation diffusion facilitator CzcD-associated flavoprotein CzcO